MLKWSRSKQRRSLFPLFRDKALPLKERFSKARRDADLVESTAFRDEVSIIGSLDFDPDEDFDSQAPLSGKAGYRLVVNSAETGFTLEVIP